MIRFFSKSFSMKKIRCLLLFITLATCSCKTPKDFVFQNVQNFSIGKADMQQARLSMDVKLYNPNNYKMKLKNADLDVFFNGDHLGKMSVPERLTVLGLDTFSMPVTIDVDMKNILPNAIQLFMNPEVTVKLTGSVKAGRHGLYIHIPVNYEGKQNISAGIKF
jgi:LEA14-like dessication related protein